MGEVYRLRREADDATVALPLVAGGVLERIGYFGRAAAKPARHKKRK